MQIILNFLYFERLLLAFFTKYSCEYLPLPNKKRPECNTSRYERVLFYEVRLAKFF